MLLFGMMSLAKGLGENSCCSPLVFGHGFEQMFGPVNKEKFGESAW